MTEERSPLEMAIDLFVFAPFGVFISVTEELPKLVEKGRTRLVSQVGMAKMMGEMAAPHLQGEAEKAVKGLLDRLAPPGPPPGAAGSPPMPEAQPSPSSSPGLIPPDPVTQAEVRVSGPTEPLHSSGPHGPAPWAGAASAGDLAITGYDTLSAMQVVQRLAGLSPSELAAVRAYEAAHRGRQTIINRADQLRADAG